VCCEMILADGSSVKQLAGRDHRRRSTPALGPSSGEPRQAKSRSPGMSVRSASRSLLQSGLSAKTRLVTLESLRCRSPRPRPGEMQRWLTVSTAALGPIGPSDLSVSALRTCRRAAEAGRPVGARPDGRSSGLVLASAPFYDSGRFLAQAGVVVSILAIVVAWASRRQSTPRRELHCL
jgi:hypothetical protein